MSDGPGQAGGDAGGEGMGGLVGEPHAMVHQAVVAEAAASSAQAAKARREKLRAQGQCINGPTHATPSVGKARCAWCFEVRRIGVSQAYFNSTRDKAAPQPPAGYVYRTRSR